MSATIYRLDNVGQRIAAHHNIASDSEARGQGIADLAQAEDRYSTHAGTPSPCTSSLYGRKAAGSRGTAECPGQSGSRKMPSLTALAVSQKACSTVWSGANPSSRVIREP